MKHVPTKLLNVSLHLMGHSITVGRLALVRRRIYFEYDSSFLDHGLPISPLKLPLKRGTATPATQLFEGLFGVFNDSLPDGWGRLLLDRKLQALGIAPELLGPLDRLTYVGKFGMGALIYEPSIAESDFPERLDLDLLADAASTVTKGEVERIPHELFALSGSSAGARPKIMVGVSEDNKEFIHGLRDLPDGFTHWLIKFNASQDPKDSGAVEYAYSLMAVAAGIEMMPTHLFRTKQKRSCFAVKRFDRIGNLRLHMHSLSGLMDADHHMPSIDYDHVLKATQFLTQDASEVKKAFHLACFNVLARNRDDHAKNFAFLMDANGKWRLSPAYDLTFSSGPGGEHCTTILGEGLAPGPGHLLELGLKFGIKKREAQEAIEMVRSSVSKWTDFADQAGLSKSSANAIKKSLLP
ncbi:MAG: type II toxin-antitoxin system HipA family toxin [Pirellula sp.]